MFFLHILMTVLSVGALTSVLLLAAVSVFTRAGWLEHHIVDVVYQSVLFLIKHVIVSLVEFVPEIWVTRILFGKDENKIIRSQLGVFIWVGYHIFDDLLHFIDIAIFPTNVAVGFIFEDVQVYSLLSIQADWDHVPSGGQVVE